MRVSLIVPETVIDILENKRRVLKDIAEALKASPGLVVLPETVTTGYQDRGDPLHDRALCEEVGGEFLQEVAHAAKCSGAMISIGFFETAGDAIYDSSVLFDGKGEILQHYRRVDEHWRNRGVDTAIYRCGTDVMLSTTPHGSFSTLICGDLFNDQVLGMTRALRPDYLLYPLAANPESGLSWEGALESYYRQELLKLKAHTLMVNLFESGPGWCEGEGTQVGGACVFSPTGEVLASLPSGSPGILTCVVP